MSNPAISSDNLLELAEAARLLGVHQSTLRRWADTGKIAHIRTLSGRRRFSRAALDRALKEMRQPSHSEKTDRMEAKIESHTLALTRQRSSELSSRSGTWYDRFTEEQRLLFRYSGQRLLGLLIQFISRKDSGETILEEGKKIAGDYGRICYRANMSASQTAEAFLFFRRSILESVLATAGLSGPNDHPNDQGGYRVLMRATDFFDSLLVSTIETFTALDR